MKKEIEKVIDELENEVSEELNKNSEYEQLKRLLEMKLEKIKTKKSKGELIVENDASGKPILAQEFRQQTPIEESNDGKDDGVLNNEK